MQTGMRNPFLLIVVIVISFLENCESVCILCIKAAGLVVETYCIDGYRVKSQWGNYLFMLNQKL